MNLIENPKIKVLRILLKSVVVHLFLVVFAQNISIAQGHKITIAVKGMIDSVAYLGYHMEGKTYVEDTVDIIDQVAVFEGEKPLLPGIYFIYVPDKIFHEFVVKEQIFRITTDIDDPVNKARIDGSKENELFNLFQKRMASFQKKSMEFKKQLETLSGQDSLAIVDQFRALEEERQVFQRNLRRENPGSFLAQLVALMERPGNIDVPDSISAADAKLYRYRAYKASFWDGTDFNDVSILRTPVFHSKLMEYFDKLVPAHPDSIGSHIDGLLQIDLIDTTVFRYILATMTNKYANSKIMGLEAVYVYLVDNYYANGKAYWANEVSVTRMKQNSARIKPILLGKRAPNFIIPDTAGTKFSINSFSQEYLILFIYDAGCGHCKKAAPKMADQYKQLKDKLSIELVTINMSDDVEEWKKFIKEHKLSGTNLGDTEGTSNIGYYYYVQSTPQIFILDKDRKIIAKQLAPEQISDFMMKYTSTNP